MQNKEIYNQIIKSGGAIVSEYKEGTMPDSEKFRQRNRIVSGLSLGVLIIEAEARSGTSITARYATEQGKTIFCIPNSIGNRKGIGTNNLIKKGAMLVQTPDEILEKYMARTKNKIAIDESVNNRKKESIDISSIPDEYAEIYRILNEPLSVNEISEITGIELTDVYAKLFLMEIEGLIKKCGNKYEII